MITYKRNKNLGKHIGGHTLQDGQVFKTHIQIIKVESKTCNTGNKSSFCCSQVVNTKTFKTYQTKRMFKTFHKLNCKSSFVIYPMECTFHKIQYVEKSEIPFNIRLNKHRKDGNDNNPKAILASIPCKQFCHNLNKHARFSLTEQINNIINSDIDTIKIRLIRRQDFWILRLDTLTLEGLNHELHNV